MLCQHQAQQDHIPPAHPTCNLHHVAPTRAIGTTSHLNSVCHPNYTQHRQSKHPQPLHGVFAAAARTSSHLCALPAIPTPSHPHRAAASASRTGSHLCRVSGSGAPSRRCRDTCSPARVPATPSPALSHPSRSSEPRAAPSSADTAPPERPERGTAAGMPSRAAAPGERLTQLLPTESTPLPPPAELGLTAAAFLRRGQQRPWLPGTLRAGHLPSRAPSVPGTLRGPAAAGFCPPAGAAPGSGAVPGRGGGSGPALPGKFVRSWGSAAPPRARLLPAVCAWQPRCRVPADHPGVSLPAVSRGHPGASAAAGQPELPGVSGCSPCLLGTLRG